MKLFFACVISSNVSELDFLKPSQVGHLLSQAEPSQAKLNFLKRAEHELDFFLHDFFLQKELILG